MKKLAQQGFILVTVMIFLMVLSLMALRELNDGLMQLTILHAWQRHRQQFLVAEKLLAQGEHRLKNSCESTGVCVNVRPIERAECADAYQVTASVKQEFDSVVLQSVYCKSLGRLSWRELDEKGEEINQ